jgi:hypothetical protein
MTEEEIRRLALHLGLSGTIRTELGLRRALRHRIDTRPSDPASEEMRLALVNLTGAIEKGNLAAESRDKRRGPERKWVIVGSVAGVIGAAATVWGIWHVEPAPLATSEVDDAGFRETLVTATAGRNEDQGEVLLRVIVGLENLGSTTASGCRTMWEPVDEALFPISFYPTVSEPANEVDWDLAAGDLHQSIIVQGFSQADFDSANLLDVWFECRETDYTSIGQVFRLDFSSASVQWGPENVPLRDHPLNTAERNSYISAIEFATEH